MLDPVKTDVRTLGRSMPRERRQSGWVEKTGKRVKKWVGFYYEYVMVDGKEKRRPRTKVIGPCSEYTKGAAQDRLREIIRGERPPERHATFEQLARWYLTTCSGRWATTTRKTMHSVFERHIIPALGKRLAHEVTKSDVEHALNAIAARPDTQSYSLLKKCLSHIRAVYEQAIEDGRIERNPASKAQLPATRKPSERFLTLDECRGLLRVAMGRDRLIVRLLMVCGLRPSELFALKSDDVLPGRLRIDEAVVLRTLGETKTDDSTAEIPLSPALEQDLRGYIREHKITGFLFPSEEGTAMAQENYLTRVLRPLGGLAGIKHLNHQVLRRTTATHFSKHGKVKDAQALLRHSNAETTLRHYQKSLDESLIAGVESWDRELLQ